MQFSLSSTVVILPAIVLWIGLTAYFQIRRTCQPSPARHIFLTGCVVYLLALIHLTAFPIDVHTGDARTAALYSESINLIPFDAFRSQDFVLNICMTIPLGLALPMLYRRFFPIPVMISVSLGAGLFFEFNQLLLRWTVGNDRYVDANDVIANASGVLLGFWLANLAVRNRALRTSPLTTLLRTDAKQSGSQHFHRNHDS